VLTNVRYLADSSAIIRPPHKQVAEMLAPLIEAGMVATCAVVDLELFPLVRDPADLPRIRASRSMSFHWLDTTDEDLRRALHINTMLAEHGHNPVAWTASVVAAVAERHQVAVLHYQATFDHIAKVTGQDIRWVAPEGELR
jgi:predicted nucleic acid-binding protein